MLDCMSCADCMGNVPFQGETKISHLQVPHDDAVDPAHDATKSKTSNENHAKSFCSICANVLMAVEAIFPNPPTSIAYCDAPPAVPALSELHHSINKPPQNLLT